MATYSDRIKELRMMRNWSQQTLADKLDITKVAVSQYERGVRKPDINVITALCDVFNVSSDYLLGNEDVTVRYLNEKDLEKLDNVPESGQGSEYYLDDDAMEIAQEVFENPEKRFLFKAIRGIPQDDIKLLSEMALRMKGTNPDG